MPQGRSGRTACSAAKADPRAPAMSRSGTTAKAATSACSSRSSCAPRTRSRNQSRSSGGGLGDSAADEVGVGVGEVRGDGEHPPDRHRLLLEDPPRHFVAPLGEPRGQAGRRRRGLEFGERVIRIAGQPERQQVLARCRSTKRRFRHRRRSHSCSGGTGWPATSSPSIGMWTWPSSPAMPHAPLTHVAGFDHAAAKPVPTIAEIEERRSASGPN